MKQRSDPETPHTGQQVAGTVQGWQATALSQEWLGSPQAGSPRPLPAPLYQAPGLRVNARNKKLRGGGCGKRPRSVPHQRGWVSRLGTNSLLTCLGWQQQVPEAGLLATHGSLRENSRLPALPQLLQSFWEL